MILDPSYDSKTLDELQAEFVTLGNDISVIDAKRRAISELIRKKEADLWAQFRTADLSVAEKEALRRVLFSRAA